MEPPRNLKREPTLLDVAIVQNAPRKGCYAENMQTIGAAFAQLRERPANLVVLPEATATGYFLEGAVYDLALPSERFARDLVEAWREACGSAEADLVAGFFENSDGTYYNSAIYITVGKSDFHIAHVHRKMFLPTYGVFDEERFLSRGRRLQAFDTPTTRAAILICEDVWHAIMPTIAAIKGARVIIVPSAAPGRGIEGESELTSVTRWREILCTTAAEHGIYLIYAGLAGFEGGKGMSGSSCVVDPRGTLLVQAPTLGECIVRATIDLGEIDLARASLPLLGDLGPVLPDLLNDEELHVPRH